jgi:uncharacterized membrane protein
VKGHDVIGRPARGGSPAPEDPPLEPAATETRLSSTGRVEAFSDGVMAIAITLLVLNLKVPPIDDVTPGGLANVLADAWPSYVAYLAAFVTIGIIWLNHRTLIEGIARFDVRLHWLNLMILLGVATLPWPTALVAEYAQRGGADASIAAALYGLTATLMATPWGFILRHLADRPELLEPGYSVAYVRAESRRGFVGLPVYATATVVALVAPLVALVAYLAIAILYAYTSQGAPIPRNTDGAQEGGLGATPPVALHHLDDGLASGLPVRKISEDVAGGAPALDLGHRGDDRVMGKGAVATGFDLSGHQVAPDCLERCRPVPDPDLVAEPQRLQPIVVADRVTIVFGLVTDEVDAQTGALEARQATVILDRGVADGARGKLGGRARRGAIRQATAAAERAATMPRRRAALETDDLDHGANLPVRPALRTASAVVRSTPSRWISQASGVETAAGRRRTLGLPGAPRCAIKSESARSILAGESGRSTASPRTSCRAARS